ncbi:MAG: DUF202 domain-containing protein [Haloferacaceae archaeon]
MSSQDGDDRTDHTEELAEERTRLARERTILAHIRTGFASFLFGVSLIGLFATVEAEAVGALFILVGAVFLVTGGRSYVMSNRRTRHLLREVENSIKRNGH